MRTPMFNILNMILFCERAKGKFGHLTSREIEEGRFYLRFLQRLRVKKIGKKNPKLKSIGKNYVVKPNLWKVVDQCRVHESLTRVWYMPICLFFPSKPEIRCMEHIQQRTSYFIDLNLKTAQYNKYYNISYVGHSMKGKCLQICSRHFELNTLPGVRNGYDLSDENNIIWYE